MSDIPCIKNSSNNDIVKLGLDPIIMHVLFMFNFIIIVVSIYIMIAFQLTIHYASSTLN